MKTKKITLTELKSLIKKIIKEEYLTEIEKYTPSIDSEEEEEELKKSWGVKEKDPYKQKDPYKNLKSDDFYDDKLKNTKLKNIKKDYKITNTSSSFKEMPITDISYLGAWEKKSNDEIEITNDKSNLDNNIKYLIADIKDEFKIIIDNNLENNWRKIQIACVKILKLNTRFLKDFQKHDEYQSLVNQMRDVFSSKDDKELQLKYKKIKVHIVNMMKKISKNIITEYKNFNINKIQEFITLLNEMYFYQRMYHEFTVNAYKYDY
jgi:hypothetical protein